MGFKLASLFVTIEAQTAKFAAQMGQARRTAADAGRAIVEGDFDGVGNELEAVFAAIPAKLAAAMAPVAGQIGTSLQKGFQPLDKIQSTLARVGTSLVHAFRFDLIEQGIEALQAGLDWVFKDATGKAAVAGGTIKAALSFAGAINSLNRFKAQVASLISPSKNLARAILLGARAGLAAANPVVGFFFGKATGRAKLLGNAIQKGLQFAGVAAKSKLVVNQLALMIRRATNLKGAIGAVGTGLSRVVTTASKLTTNLTHAKQAAGGIKSVMGEIAIAAGFVAVGYKVVEFFKDAVMGASHLGETVDKVDAVLGSGSKAVKEYADDMARDFGLVKQVTLDAASGFAGLAKGLGKLKGDKLSDFSIKMTQMAADFSSFADIDFETAQKSIKIGLTGEPSDVLKSFGVIVLESTTEQQALAMGMKKTNGSLTQQQKLMARAALITRQLADAEDNLALTQDSTQNRMRRLKGQMENLSTTIGTALLPFVNKALGMFSNLAKWIGASFEKNKAAVEGFVAKLVVGLNIAEAVVKNWPAALKIVQLYVGEVMHNIGAHFDALVQNAKLVGGYVARAFFNLFKEVARASGVFFDNLKTNFASFSGALANFLANPMGGFNFNWTPMLDGFQLTVEKFPDLLKPALIDMSDEIKKEWAKISGDVDWDPKVKIGNAVKKGQAVNLPDKPDKKGTVSDLAAFAKDLQEAVTGKNGVAERQAKASEKTVDEMKKLNEQIRAKLIPGQGGAAGPGWQAAGMA